MKPTTIITFVSRLEPALTSGMKVTTPEGIFAISDKIHSFDVDCRILEKSFREKSAVALSTENKRIVSVYIPAADIVWKISEDKNNPNRMVVALETHPTQAFINKQTSDFEKILNGLTKAKNLKTKCLIAINPENYFIEAIEPL